MTGVQTCALPISIAGHPSEYLGGYSVQKTLEGHGIKTLVNDGEDIRSEERRVGKECRSRWSPYH